jgi:hypothetical protein
MPLADAPQSNRQHAVPQNIMDVEFKLIGDLTMRQFSYLLLCGILSYVSFVAVIGIFKVPLGVTFGLLGLGLAFLPIGERGLDDWIASFIRAINSPTQRMWKKEPEIPFAFSYRSLDVVKQELITLAPTSSRRKLEEYLRYQTDTVKKDPLDIPEQEYILKVRNAFAYSKSTGQSFGGPSIPSVGVSVIEDEVIESPLNVTGSPNIPEFPVKAEIPKQEQQVGESVNEQKSPVPVPSFPQPGPEKTEVAVPKIVQPPAPAPKPRVPVRLLQEGDLSFRDESEIGMPSITPDMHSGRKFTNLLPSSGELVLPIKGERILRTTDQVRNEGDLKEKTEKLQKLLIHIREKEGVPLPTRTAKKLEDKPVVAEVTKEAEDVVENLKEKNESLNTDIERLKKTIEQGKSMSQETSAQEEQLKRLEEQKEKITSSYSELGRKYEELQKELDERKKTDITSSAATFSANIANRLPTMTKEPNTISGIVKDSDGKLMINILLIVKNKKGEAVRAFKTNSMGQFLLLTPMDNGIYTVELSPSNNLTETFDIIPVEVKGEIIPPMEFTGKK